MEIKHALNSIIDCIYEKKRTKKAWEPLTNQGIVDGLSDGKIFICCLVSRNNNIVAKAISKLSGPFSHVVAVCTMAGIVWDAHGEYSRIHVKLEQYYGDFISPDYLVLASADENGMNYFDISEYQNREMVIFDITGTQDEIEIKEYDNGTMETVIHGNDKSDAIIKDFLSPQIMNAHYDYTGLIGWVVKAWKWLYRKFDDERAYYCSEVVYDVFKRNGIGIADSSEPSPTDIYNYCKSRYRTAYSNLKNV